MGAGTRLCGSGGAVQHALGDLCTAMGTRFHLRGDGGNLTAALADAGLPQEIAKVAESTACDEVIRSSHAQAVALAGGDIGTPVVSVALAGGARQRAVAGMTHLGAVGDP